MNGGPLRILIAAAADSSREVLLGLLSEDLLFQVCGILSNAREVANSTKKLRPHVILLSDRLESLSLLSAITEVMVECPTPILVVSADDATETTAVALGALRAGALSIVRLPGHGERHRNARVDQQLLATIRAMAQVKLVRRWSQAKSPVPPATKDRQGSPQIVAVAASTGGPAALKTILDQLPENFPVPILIVQHIAQGFVAGVAEWLNQTSPLQVGVAGQGVRLRAGAAYLAPDDLHLGLNHRTSILLSDEPPVNGFRPSATYLFDSVAKSFGRGAVGVILTGMGDDGLEGLKTLAGSGGSIIAQSRASSVVFGMPGVVVQQGLADRILGPEMIAQALVEACGKRVQ